MTNVEIDNKPVDLDSGYIWGNFNYGDIVWLDNYRLEGFDNLVAAYFVSEKNGIVELRSLSEEACKKAYDHGADNVHQIIGA